MTQLEVLDEHRCMLGEGPVYDERAGALLWVDIVAGEVHRRALDGPRATASLGEAVGAVALREDGGWLLAMATGPVLRDPDGTMWPLAGYAELRADAVAVRSNDGKVAPDGSFVFGTMAWEATPDAGTLYVLRPGERTARSLLEPVTISNGLGWSPDGQRMYYVDTVTQRIDVLDVDLEAAVVHARTPLVEIPAGDGAPDGLTVDAEGGIWVALWGGGSVRRYTPDGRQDAELVLPCSQVTSCAFVGAGLDLLAITTASIGLDGSEELAGATFVADVGVRGLSTVRYPA